MNDEQRQRTTAALEAERAGYERRGLTDRAAQVDAQMKRVRGAGRQTRPRGAGASTRGEQETG